MQHFEEEKEAAIGHEPVAEMRPGNGSPDEESSALLGVRNP